MSEVDDLMRRFGRRDFPEFRDIGEGVAVRPLLKTDDLKLIRRAFEGYVRSGLAGSDGVKCRDLFRRMLQKVK